MKLMKKNELKYYLKSIFKLPKNIFINSLLDHLDMFNPSSLQ
jgi:hypothetical protein